MDKENTGKVTLKQYQEAILCEPDLLEVFDYISKGTIKIPFQSSENEWRGRKTRITGSI